MESACVIQEILLQSECNFMLVIWKNEVGWVLTGRGHNFLLSYNLFRGMQIKLHKYTCSICDSSAQIFGLSKLWRLAAT